MDQPGLGILIADLRKRQGLTQEELVERCNINVRTIQRIEAGEVNPRSYTVRNILEALGTTIDDVFKEDHGHVKAETGFTDAEGLSSTNRTIFITGAISGIIYLFLYTLLTTFSTIHEFWKDKAVSDFSYSILSISNFVFMAWFFYSLFKLGQSKLSNLFKYTSLIFIIVNTGLTIWDINLYTTDIIQNSWDKMAVSMPSLFIYGLCYIFLGIGLFTVRKSSIEMVKWAGISGIIGGFGYASIILFPVGILGTLIFEILLVVLLFHYAKNKMPLNPRG